MGFSGGMDSTVLLHLLCRWRDRNEHGDVALQAIHVNHQLQSHASDWQRHCQRVCQQWDVPLIVEAVDIDLHQSSPEQAARDARYRSFNKHVSEAGTGAVLMLAHHRDDQVETLLQRLARGSGPLGLGAMLPVTERLNMSVFRPLLEQDREQLANYAAEQKLVWVEDPSNQNDQIERNYIRRQILPAWRKIKPQLNQTIARSARLNQEASALLDQLAALDMGPPRADQGLAIGQLTGLALPRQKNLLRYWLVRVGALAPSETLLLRVIREVLPAADDGSPMVEWGALSIRRFRQHLYLAPSHLESDSLPELGRFGSVAALDGLASSLGVLRVDPPFDGAGASQHGAPDGQLETGFSLRRLQAAPLQLSLRTGGERVKPAGQLTKPLKHWFQALTVAPWLRPYWPILYCGDQVAGLPGLLVCDGFEPESEQDRVVVTWHWRIPVPVID
ncbi:tRNA lysidine(34) synthetase TilS [Ketobacter nezhaii]|uniref:tRNA lysidine(34) synthetase TilS n=1 Tax=Ketobacter sp. MCCC 1A13808 TaxID=2602738 RepID=UPI00294FFCEC|nr:tRNA lysidine(34) synthetase TilS [Ketobacter sp. MCCC 1A13808]